MLSKKTMMLAAGATLGVFAAPYVQNMLGVQVSDGFGTDDIVAALVVVASVLIVDAVL